MRRILTHALFAAALLGLSLTGAAQAQPKTAKAKQPVALFYLMETPKSTRSFEQNIDKIGLLVPTWYGVSKDGLVTGAPNPGVLSKAKAARLPVMPIISLTDRAGLHQLMQNEAAKKSMADALVREAKANGYVGFHFDFENISYLDRDAFTLMAKQTADALHGAGFTMGIAVVPNAPGHPGKGAYSKWMWEYWRGAYDIEALGKIADEISLMTYDQHTRWTPPGPVGGMPWVLENLDYALKVVPAEKLSLGIPLYGYRWFADNPVRADGSEAVNINGVYFDGDESIPMAREYGVKVQWDDVQKESWYVLYRDQMNEWVSMPDARSFKARYDLVKQRGLVGFSAWVLGSEDPAIWDVLPVVKR